MIQVLQCPVDEYMSTLSLSISSHFFSLSDILIMNDIASMVPVIKKE